MIHSTVLVPLDGSLLSRESVGHICRLLDPECSEVTVLRVAAPPTGILAEPARVLPVNGWGLPEYTSEQQLALSQHPIYPIQAEASIEAELEAELLHDAQCLVDSGFVVHAVVRFGEPAEEIVAYAEETNVDLIAMATHGRTGLKRLMLGSVAERVLLSSPVPLLLVRPFAQRGTTKEQIPKLATR